MKYGEALGRALDEGNNGGHGLHGLENNEDVCLDLHTLFLSD